MKTTRREFVGTAAGLALGAFIARRSFAQSPNDRLGIGLIGCGKRGMELLDECLTSRDKLNLEFPMVCDVYRTNLASAVNQIKAKTGSEPKQCTRYGELLASPDVDVVIIATPDFQHCTMMMDAAKAGKHIYVEAPMGISIESAAKASDAVKAAGVVCQVGTQRRSDPRYVGAAKLMATKPLGNISRVDLYWAEKGPLWREPYRDIIPELVDWDGFTMDLLGVRYFDSNVLRNWQNFRECTLGLPGLFGSHLTDLVAWYTGEPYPQAVTGMGTNAVWRDRQHYDSVEYTFHYPRPTSFLVQCSLSLANGARRSEATFYGPRGKFDTDSWTVTSEGALSAKSAQAVMKAEPIKGTSHLENWIECVRKKDVNTRADVNTGFQHTVASFMAFAAMESGLRMQYWPEERVMRKGVRPKSPYDKSSSGAVM